MTYQGRSQDDLPLAAYTTGAAADEPEDEVVPETPQLSQQDVIAMAMGIAPPAAEEAAPTTEAAEAAAPRARRSLPRPSLPRPSLPRPSLKLPGLGGRGRADLAAEAPFRVTAQAAPGAAAQAAQMAAPTAFAMPLVQAPAARPVSTGATGRVRGLNVGGLGTSLRSPRTAVRDPRVLFGGMIAIGVVVLGVAMLGGGGSAGGVVPGASASTAPGVGVPTVPGSASIDVAGDFAATFALTGTAVVGKPADGQLAATWTDGAGSSVTLTGRISSGTRTTTSELTLAIVVMRNGAPVTLTSEAGECTVGMAEKIVNVTGSFVCPEITSDGGRFTVKLSGKFGT